MRGRLNTHLDHLDGLIITMRLLKLQGNGELSLAEFISSDIPPYAILSHTWAADHEEVTFRHLLEGTGKSKVGYGKIWLCTK